MHYLHFLSYTLVIPFLKILFNRLKSVANPGEFQFNTDYIGAFSKYYLSVFIEKNGQAGALMLVVLIVIVASLFKNGFIFLANNSMAYIRASTVRDLGRNLYHKVLRLPLSFFTDARKGDVMTRISNDVQEIEISVMASLTMMFRDPMYILIFVIYLFVSKLRVNTFCSCTSSCKRMADWTGKPYFTIIFTCWSAKSGTTSFSSGGDSYRSKDCQGIQC